MKNVFSIFLFVISSQILLAHPGSEHTHNTFMGEWAWLLVPAVAIIALVWKFSNNSESKKSEN